MMTKRRLLGAGATLAIFLLGFVFGIFFGKSTEIVVEPHRLKQMYALFTWQGSSEDVCFAIVPKYKGSKFLANPFNKRGGQCGISHLEGELATLPKETHVEWTNWSGFSYPKQNVAMNLIMFARSKGVDLKLNPVFDKPVFPDNELGPYAPEQEVTPRSTASVTPIQSN